MKWLSTLVMLISFSAVADHETIGIGWSCDSQYTPHGFTVKWKELNNRIHLNTMCADWWGRSENSRKIYNECLQCAKSQMKSMCKQSKDRTSKYCEASKNWID